MDQQFSPNDVTSDDRLWALLAYILTPIVPIIILLMPDKKARPFLKAHNTQALILGIVEWVLNAILTPLAGIGCITGVIFLGINIWLGVRANKGEIIVLPWLTDFIKQQGW
jgi:uncharacterized membrane protein